MSKTGATSRKLLAAIHGSFFVSGLCCLIYEIVWQRVAVRLLGATVPSTVAILCAFMVGLSVGAFLISRNLAKIRRPLRCYASLEIAIGMCGALSVFLSQSDAVSWLSDSIAAAFGQSFFVTQSIKGFVVFLLLLVPTALMGATLPTLAHFSSTLRNELSAAALTTSLYATNTSGAVLGTLAAGFVLLPYLGITKTLLLASAFNFIASNIALYCARHLEFSTIEESGLSNEKPKKKEKGNKKEQSKKKENVGKQKSAKKQETSKKAKETNEGDRNEIGTNRIFSTPALGVASAMVFFSSLLSMTMQVVWTRFFTLIFGSSTYAFSTVTAVYILGLSLGAFSAPSIARSVRKLGTSGSSLGSMGIVAAAIGLAVAVTLFQYQATPGVFLSMMKWSTYDITTIGTFAVVVISCALWLVLLPATLFGAMFPLAITSGIEEESVFEAYSESQEPHYPFGRATSKLYILSILGCVIGAICGGIIFSPALSAWKFFDSIIATTTTAVSLIYVLIAVLATSKLARYGVDVTRHQLISIAILVSAATTLIVLRPDWNQALMSGGVAFVQWSDLRNDIPTLLDRIALKTASPGQESDRVVLYAEGENTTVSVITSPSNNLTYLKTNGKVEAAIPIDPLFPAVRSDFPTQSLLGLLPVILHNSKNKSLQVAAIGLGSGTTCGALAQVPWVSKVTALEIEPSMREAEHFFKPGNYAPFEPIDGKVKVALELTDARNYLATTPEKFDVIVSQPAEPWVSGASDLYTTEFFTKASNKLANDGVFCQWVQLYSIGEQDLATIMATFNSVFPSTTAWQSPRAGEVLLVGMKEDLKLSPELLEKKCNEPIVSKMLQRIGIHSVWELLANQRLAQADLAWFADFYNGDLNSDDNLLLEYSLANIRSRDPLEGKCGDGYTAMADWNKSTTAKELLRQFDSNGASSTNSLNLGLAHWEQRLNSGFVASDLRYLPALLPLLAESERPNHGKHRTAADRIAQQLLPDSAFVTLDDKAKIRRLAVKGVVPGSTLKLADRLSPDIKYGADFLEDLGTIYLNGKNADKAIACFSLSNQTPARSRSMSGLALARWLKGNISDENLSLMEQSLALDPNQYVARVALGQSLARRGDYQKALPHLRAAAQVYPASLPWELVACVAVQQKNWSLANQNMRVIEQKFRWSPQVLAMNYLIALGQKQEERARKIAETFYSSNKSELTTERAEEFLQRLFDPPSPIATTTVITEDHDRN